MSGQEETREEARARLPEAYTTAPTCGACHGETVESTGGWYTCEGCRIDYRADTLEPSYPDEETRPCGNPCGNLWHRTQAIPGPRFLHWDCQPCALPAGHDGMHFTGCRVTVSPPPERSADA